MAGWNKPLELEMNTDETCHHLEFHTSQQAWEGINEAFIRLDPSLFDRGGTANSGVSVSYNIFVRIKRAWMDPEFDFGKYFNYTDSKWTTLLNNYIDFNKLDLLRSRIRCMKQKYNQNYNLPYVFHNTHDNGKQCLLTATFSKRFQQDTPVITIHLRASEVTKRLAFDLLLVQRMAEYVYGPDQPVQINIFACQMYGNVETLLMYNTYKPIKKVMKGMDKSNPWYQRVMEIFKKFMNGPESEFSRFKVFFRSYKVIRRDNYPYKPLLAKDLTIEDEDIEYPEECISYSQRRKYKQKYLAKLRKEANDGVRK